jgi:DNA-binding MarR family transcriptional regulator
VTGDGPVAERLTAALDRLGQALRVMRADAAYRAGVSPVQAAIMEHLTAGPRTVTDLARRLDLTAPTVSDAVLALRRKALVEIVVLPGRGKPHVLTAAGRALVEQLTEAQAPLLAAATCLDGPTQEAALEATLRIIGSLQRAGVVTVARTCTTCRFFRDGDAPRCQLLDIDLPPAALRVDCPEHEPAA